MKNSSLLVLAAAALLFACGAAQAQAQRAPYGTPISLDQARRVVAAGHAESRKMNLPVGVAIAVLDSGCHLIALELEDNANLGVAAVAQDKAYTACAFRSNTKDSQAFLAGGGNGLILLKLRDFTPVEGGQPIVVDGKTIGSVGVSGGTGAQDGQVAGAAAAAIAR